MDLSDLICIFSLADTVSGIILLLLICLKWQVNVKTNKQNKYRMNEIREYHG